MAEDKPRSRPQLKPESEIASAELLFRDDPGAKPAKRVASTMTRRAFSSSSVSGFGKPTMFVCCSVIALSLIIVISLYT